MLRSLQHQLAPSLPRGSGAESDLAADHAELGLAEARASVCLVVRTAKAVAHKLWLGGASVLRAKLQGKWFWTTCVPETFSRAQNLRWPNASLTENKL